MIIYDIILISFAVDASMAGCGRVAVSVQGRQSRPHVEMSADADNVYLVTFTPTEGVLHNVAVRFNDCEVCGKHNHVNDAAVHFHLRQNGFSKVLSKL